jgi:hypothetical protein
MKVEMHGDIEERFRLPVLAIRQLSVLKLE